MNGFREHRYFIKVLFGCSLAHIIHPELLFFWVHPLFCIKLRGQHLYLAVAERSSSHPKTNKYWGLVWLFLALNTNYIWLYSWNWVKNLLRPIWTHFCHPQSRILSPFRLSWLPFLLKILKLVIFFFIAKLKGLRILDCGWLKCVQIGLNRFFTQCQLYSQM